MTDDARYWPMTLEEATEALRQAAERLARAPDDGWLTCHASQPRPPRQADIDYWYLRQGYRIANIP